MANEVCFRNMDLDRPWLLEQYQKRGGYEMLSKVLRGELEPAQIVDEVKKSGLRGRGGAGFPASVKLNPGPERKVDLLVINGAECEPYITCDDTLMRERAADIVDGIGILQHLVDAGECLIGIEDNKPEAIASLRQAIAAQDDVAIEVVVVSSVYPSGGEKQLIEILTGKQVPAGGLPASHWPMRISIGQCLTQRSQSSRS